MFYKYKISRLHFGETFNCIFQVLVDPNSQYESYINKYGQNPSKIRIPYNLVYNKYNR